MTTLQPNAQPAGSSSLRIVPQCRQKLVVRRLPPALPAAIFWKSVDEWTTPQTCLWKSYVEGKSGNGHDARQVFSRAYILFSSAEAVFAFHQAFDGHIFRSKTGIEYQAVVEFAPVQKTPHKAKSKADTRQRTIEDDPDFKSYLDSLSAPLTKMIIDPTVPVAPISTPLLDHLRANAQSRIRSGVKSKSKAHEATTQPTRNAALASVSKAASRRAPQDSDSMTMVAGKGREVTITATRSDDISEASAGQGKKSRRGLKPSKQSSVDSASSGPIVSGRAANSTTGRIQHAFTSSGEVSGAHRGKGKARGGRPHDPGKGDGSGPARSPRTAVVEILSRNAQGEGGRGRGSARKANRGRGALGRGVGEEVAVHAGQAGQAGQARIDM